MKTCYVDESGNSQDPCLIMVGVVVDSTRLNRTREEFAEVFDIVQGLFQENLKEIKGAKMIFGRDRWRNVDPDIRKRIGQFFCNWITSRKHHLAVAAIDRSCFASRNGCSCTAEVNNNPWLAASLHIALQLQKHHQRVKSNKGHTFLFVDENKKEADRLAELLFSPPVWTDQYYDRGKKQAQLDQLIDSAFTVKSHHAGLVQVADLFAFMLRRYVELNDYDCDEQWVGERSLIDGYAKVLGPRMLPLSTRWPKKPKCECSRWYNELAPNSIKTLGK